MSIKVKPENFQREMKRRMKLINDHAQKAVDRSKRRALAKLRDNTPVDMGLLRNSWRVTHDGIENHAPYAGIVEMGLPPGIPVPAGQVMDIADWAQRKLGLSPGVAAGAAKAIARKFEKYGRPPEYFVKDTMPAINRILKRAVDREIARQAKKR